MSVSRILIFGEPTAGKTTLLRYFHHAHPDIPVREMDDEIMYANGDEWPHDAAYRQDIIVPGILQAVLAEQDIIFFASSMPEDELRRARANGFKIYILEISRETFMSRNHARITMVHHEEQSPWTIGNHNYVSQIERAGFVDGYIDGEVGIDQIAMQIIALREQNL